MKLEYFDIHSHLYFPDFDKDREEEIEKIAKHGIGTISIGTDFESSKVCLELAKKHNNIYATVGQHPGDLKEDSVFEEKLRKLAGHEKVVAIGECGLDYFRLPPENLELKMIQKTVFEYHVDLALDLNKPLMLHIRNSKGTQDAYLDALDILEHHAKTSGGALKGNAHFFAGDQEVLDRLLAIGFTVSFTGVITFTSDYDELIRNTPLDMIMAETDAPFVAPVPHRGKRNSPLYVPKVVERIAEIKGEDLEVVKKALFDNTLRQFPALNSSLASLGLL
ncbi:MAG: TatD DNase family protein [Parcubacteria group bacterium Gr01-1014_46]|nr:MAG: TatD DNase family protein [Parcubacteria group bacterium Gr01-1014_46]